MRKRTLVFFISAIFLICVLIFFESGEFRSALRARIQRKIVQTYLQKIEPSLPFKIVNFSIRAEWKDFRAGRIPSMDVVLQWGVTKVLLSGPIEVKRSPVTQNWRIDYVPRAQLSGVASPVSAELWIELPALLNHIDSWGITAQLSKFAHQAVPELELLEAKGSIQWRDQKIQASVTAQKAKWIQSSERAASLSEVHLEIQSSPDQKILAQIKAQGGEALWDSLFVNPRLTGVTANLTLDKLDPLERPMDIQLMGNHWKVDLNTELKSKSFKWKTSDLALNDLHQLLGVAPWMKVTQGQIVSLGQWIDGQTRGSVALKNLDIELKDGSRLGQTQARWDWTQSNDHQVWIEAPVIRYQKLRGSLKPTTLYLNSKDSTRWKAEVREPLGLKVEGLSLKLGKVDGEIAKDFLSYSLKTPFESEPTSLEWILGRFCVKGQGIPPAKVQLTFPEVEFSSGKIQPKGLVIATLFKGEIRVSDIALFSLNTETPELDFSVSWDHLQLTELSDWLGFGEMDGIFTGHASQVTLHSWLPTQFGLKAELKPNQASDIVFSPQAMKNVVRVFAGSDLDTLPGVAHWMAFGWPSRLFGGYDVLYGGIDIQSQNGRITVNTLDPPKIVSIERKHYVLYGPRFKMPLNSTHYPLVVDAFAMGKFVKQMLLQLKQISASKKTSKEISDETNSECRPDAN